MKIYEEIDPIDFDFGPIAQENADIIKAWGKAGDFNQLMEDYYPDGATEEQLETVLWLDWEWVFEQLEIPKDATIENAILED